MSFRSPEDAEREGRELLAKLPPPLPPKPRDRFRARISGRFGKGGKDRGATVTIDRALTFHVRAFNSPKVRSMPIEKVALWVFTKMAEAEGRANRIKRAPKWHARRAGKGRR